MAKATATGRSFQEALTSLRAQPLGDGLPSPAEILHGRSLTTRKAVPVDITAVRDSLIALQAKYIKGHDKAHWARAQRQLITGEEVYYMASNDNWLLGLITGTRDTGRSYDVLAGDGTLLRRNRSHLKPRSFDIPVIRANMNASTSTASQSERQNISLSVPEHPPKVKYTTSHNNGNISLAGPEHPPKVKYTEKTVPKLVIKQIGDTSYDSYIAETLMPLKSAIRPVKQTRFADQPVTSVKAIPPRRRPHPPKWSRDMADPDLLIPIELSQPRAEQDQDLGGNLSDVSHSESHQSEETLPNVPLGQSQAQEGNSTSDCIALHLLTPFSFQDQPQHPPKGKYFQRQGQDRAVRKALLAETLTTLMDHQLQRGAIRTNRRATAKLQLLEPQHPPKVKYTNIQKIFPKILQIRTLTVPAHPPKVKYTVLMQNTRQGVNQAAERHPDHHHLRLAVIRTGVCTHPLKKWPL